MKKILSTVTISILSLSISTLSAKDVTLGYNYKIPSHIMTPNKVQTRIGKLNFYDGIPTDETLKKVYDNLDFIRGIDVFLNFIPATSIEGMRMGMDDMGVNEAHKVMVFDHLMDSSPRFDKTWSPSDFEEVK